MSVEIKIKDFSGQKHNQFIDKDMNNSVYLQQKSSLPQAFQVF